MLFKISRNSHKQQKHVRDLMSPGQFPKLFEAVIVPTVQAEKQGFINQFQMAEPILFPYLARKTVKHT